MLELGFLGLLNNPKQIFAQLQKLEVKLANAEMWGWVVVVPLLNTTLEVEESPGMVWGYCSSILLKLQILLA